MLARIIPNWRAVLGKAWSVRLMLTAALLTGIEAILPFFTPHEPSLWFAVATFATVCAALVARFVAQPRMHDGHDANP